MLVVHGEIALGGADAPFDAALVRLHLPGKQLEQGGDRDLVAADDGDLVVPVHGEAEVVDDLHAVHGLAETLHEQPVLARLPLGLEAHPGIAP